MTHKRITRIIAGLVGALALAQLLWHPVEAQTSPSGVERLYILNCGEGVAGDISRWSPGVNVGQSMDFVDSCYLIRHRQGWLLWDTGLADAVAAMPDGLRPADPSSTNSGSSPRTSSTSSYRIAIPTISATSTCSCSPRCWCKRRNTKARLEARRDSRPGWR